MSKTRAGFTLIEVLVVVTIIGILVAILTINFNDARMQARDKTRKTDLQSLQLAIETYRSQNGSFPAQGCGSPGGQWAGPGSHPSWGATCEQYIVGLVPDYIAALPKDPNQEYEDGEGFLYLTNADRSAYKVLVHNSVESDFITSPTQEFSRYPVQCGGSTQSNAYGVYSLGAECW